MMRTNKTSQQEQGEASPAENSCQTTTADRLHPPLPPLHSHPHLHKINNPDPTVCFEKGCQQVPMVWLKNRVSGGYIRVCRFHGNEFSKHVAWYQLSAAERRPFLSSIYMLIFEGKKPKWTAWRHDTDELEGYAWKPCPVCGGFGQLFRHGLGSELLTIRGLDDTRAPCWFCKGARMAPEHACESIAATIKAMREHLEKLGEQDLPPELPQAAKDAGKLFGMAVPCPSTHPEWTDPRPTPPEESVKMGGPTDYELLRPLKSIKVPTMKVLQGGKVVFEAKDFVMEAGQKVIVDLDAVSSGQPKHKRRSFVRVTAPHFVAGVEIVDGVVVRAAPILAYMVRDKWTEQRLVKYIGSVRWKMEFLDEDAQTGLVRKELNLPVYLPGDCEDEMRDGGGI